MGDRWSAGPRSAICVALAVLLASPAAAIPLDENGDIRLGLRSYVNTRIGTENTDVDIVDVPVTADRSRQIFRSLTFPVSSAGHVRQNRFFIEVDLHHDLSRLLKEGFGPLALLKQLPFDINRFSYRLTYRGEYDGVYDWGPREYRTAEQFRDPELVAPNIISGEPIDVNRFRTRLRDVASVRNRLFQAFIDFGAGDLWLRFGRQILAWGETDVFRLLDNINPLDNSFGGFLVSLDERRVPLDMLRANYYIGEIPYLPLRDVVVEAYGAIDDEIGSSPGIPTGSPWGLPNLNVPGETVITVRQTPARTFKDMRGGFRLSFSLPIPGIRNADVTLAHYYTYLDTPEVEVFTNEVFPTPIDFGNRQGAAVAVQRVTTVAITGGSTSFLLPAKWVRPIGLSNEPVIRMELAYFNGEPRWSQSQLDPFIFTFNPDNGFFFCPEENKKEGGFCTGGGRTGDSVNFVVGVDLQQWLRWLNPNQTFFISTQFFYKHLNDALSRKLVDTPSSALAGQSGLYDGEVLPVPKSIESPDRWGLPSAAAEPILIRQPTDQFLQTLLIGTSYFSGRINPNFTLLYDWVGAWVMQPSVTFIHDPFRFTVSYSALEAGALRGGSGTSLLRDRDNVLFQWEYTI